MIAAMGFRREDVYICNVVKCRPPGNRTPEPDEMAACGPFLRAQLQALRPRVIVALGRTPAQFLLNTSAPISRLRGRLASWEGIPVMPTYHPAYLLRMPSAKREAWEDLQVVMAELKKGE
jgi:DNA polymerase